jgi:hypothetical protein
MPRATAQQNACHQIAGDHGEFDPVNQAPGKEAGDDHDADDQCQIRHHGRFTSSICLPGLTWRAWMRDKKKVWCV